MENNENTVVINIQLKDYSNEPDIIPKDKELFIYNNTIKLGDNKTMAKESAGIQSEAIDWNNVTNKPDMLKGQGQYSIVENIAATPLNNSVEVGIQPTDKINTYNFSGDISLNITLEQINYLKELEINNEIYQVISCDKFLNNVIIVLSKEINIDLDETKKYQVVFKGFNINNQSNAAYSHIEGSENNIKSSEAKYSHVEGHGHEINRDIYCCHVEGEYSDINDTGYVHVVGNGEKDEYEQIKRSNAHTLDWDGNAWFSGKVKIGGNHYQSTAAETLATENFVKTYIPLNKGEGKDSIQTINSQAISDNSIALGNNTIAGCKGYYIKSIDLTNKKIYLSKEKVLPQISAEGFLDASINTGYEVEDYFSLITKTAETARNHYNFCSKIISVENNVITYDESLPLPFTSETQFYDDDYIASPSLFVPSKPLNGIVNLFPSNFAVGEETKAVGENSFSEGYNNISAGASSHTEGRGNKAGYAAHAEGRNTEALGHGAHTEGTKTKALGNYSHAEGSTNTAEGLNSHAEGIGNAAIGTSSHVEGSDNIVNGNSSHGEGRSNKIISGDFNHIQGQFNKIINGTHNDVGGNNNQANGNSNMIRGSYNIASGNQTVFGQYNKEDSLQTFILGGGTSTERKNIFTIDNQGNTIISGDLTIQGEINFQNPPDNYIYIFNTIKDFTNYFSTLYYTIDSYRNTLKLTPTGDARIIHNFKNKEDIKNYPYIKLRLKINGSLDSLYFLLNTNANLGFTCKIPNKQWTEVIFSFKEQDYNYYIDSVPTSLKDNSKYINAVAEWQKGPSNFRLDIPNTQSTITTSEEAYIEYIGFFKTLDEAKTFTKSGLYTDANF